MSFCVLSWKKILESVNILLLDGEVQRNEGEKSQWLWLHGGLTQIVGMLSSACFTHLEVSSQCLDSQEERRDIFKTKPESVNKKIILVIKPYKLMALSPYKTSTYPLTVWLPQIIPGHQGVISSESEVRTKGGPSLVCSLVMRSRWRRCGRYWLKILISWFTPSHLALITQENAFKAHHSRDH